MDFLEKQGIEPATPGLQGIGFFETDQVKERHEIQFI